LGVLTESAGGVFQRLNSVAHGMREPRPSKLTTRSDKSITGWHLAMISSKLLRAANYHDWVLTLSTGGLDGTHSAGEAMAAVRACSV